MKELIEAAVSVQAPLETLLRELKNAEPYRQQLEDQAKRQALVKTAQAQELQYLMDLNNTLKQREADVEKREQSLSTLRKDLSLARVETKTARDAEKKFREKFEQEREKYNISQNRLGQVRRLAPHLFDADGNVRTGLEAGVAV